MGNEWWSFNFSPPPFTMQSLYFLGLLLLWRYYRLNDLWALIFKKGIKCNSYNWMVDYFYFLIPFEFRQIDPFGHSSTFAALAK